MRLLLTRPEREARRSAARLEAMGHGVLCAPIFEIRPTGLPAPHHPHGAILITSVNGADWLDKLPGWQENIVYAVGPRTAETVQARGTPKNMVIAEGDAASMIPLIKAQMPPGARLIHVTGVDHKAEPDASLRAAGFDVTTWTPYQACAAQKLPETIANALGENRLEAVLHYSRRSAQTLLDLIPEPLREKFQNLHQLCLSEDVATPLRALPDIRIAVAPEPSEQALFALLEGRNGEA